MSAEITHEDCRQFNSKNTWFSFYLGLAVDNNKQLSMHKIMLTNN